MFHKVVRQHIEGEAVDFVAAFSARVKELLNSIHVRQRYCVGVFGPGRRVPKATLVVLLVFISSRGSKNP